MPRRSKLKRESRSCAPKEFESGVIVDISRVEALQAKSQLTAFATDTGGQAFFPNSLNEYADIYSAIKVGVEGPQRFGETALGYSISYDVRPETPRSESPNIAVDLVNPQTNESLRIADDKGNSIQYRITIRSLQSQ